MTAIVADFDYLIASLKPPLRTQVRLAFMALNAIFAQHGIVGVLEWALAAGTDPARAAAFAILCVNSTTNSATASRIVKALRVTNDFVNAHNSGDQKQIRDVRKRLNKALDALAAGREP